MDADSSDRSPDSGARLVYVVQFDGTHCLPCERTVDGRFRPRPGAAPRAGLPEDPASVLYTPDGHRLEGVEEIATEYVVERHDAELFVIHRRSTRADRPLPWSNFRGDFFWYGMRRTRQTLWPERANGRTLRLYRARDGAAQAPDRAAFLRQQELAATSPDELRAVLEACARLLGQPQSLLDVLRQARWFRSPVLAGRACLPAVYADGPSLSVTLFAHEDMDGTLALSGRVEVLYAADAQLLAPAEVTGDFTSRLGRLLRVYSADEPGAVFPPPTPGSSERSRGARSVISPARGEERVLAANTRERYAWRRPAAEAELRAEELPLKFNRAGEFEIPPRRLRNFFQETLPALVERNVLLRVHQDLFLILGRERRALFEVDHKGSGIDWFSGAILVPGFTPAVSRALFRAYMADRDFARTDEGWVDLETLGLAEMIATLKSLGVSVRADGSVARILPGHLMALELEDRLRGEEHFARLKQSLKQSLSATAFSEQPASGLSKKGATIQKKYPELSAALRPYQWSGVEFLRHHHALGLGGILADEMGLGKTLQALGFLAELLAESSAKTRAGGADPAPGAVFGPAALVVGPVAALGVWQGECARFAPNLAVTTWHGGARRDEEFPRTGLVLTSFGVLVRDAERFENADFVTVLVDEAQHVKNHGTLAARVLRRLRARSRFCLTGTPFENHLHEYHSLIDFVFPGLLGTHRAFRLAYADESTLPRLRARTAPFVLRRTKAQVLAELPPRTETTVQIPMSDRQAALYEAARQHAVESLAEAGEAYLVRMLPHLMRLRRLACHPDVDRAQERTGAELLEENGKLAFFIDLADRLARVSGAALVFSQFTDVLELAARALEARGHAFLQLTGATPAARRTKLVESFQNGTGRFFLISLKAGGTALTLTRADTVIHLDPWWNPAVERQATDRVHRIGQTQPVFVYRLVSAGTVEERVLELQEKKRALFASIFTDDVDSGPPPALDRAELRELLRRD